MHIIYIPLSMFTAYGWLQQMQCSQNRHSFHCAWYLQTIHLFPNVQVFMDITMCQTVKKLTSQNNTVPPSSRSRSWITLALLDPEDDGNMLHQNIGNYLPVDVAPQHLRWPKPSSVPLTEAQVEQYVYSPHSMEWFTVQPPCLTALHISM